MAADGSGSDRTVDLYARFLPKLIVEQALTEQGHSDEAFGGAFQGAVMFADISGFTALAERFGEQGAVGAERLTSTLNDYYAHLVQCVVDHGGDVLKFAGDAVLAIWREGDEVQDLRSASWRAAHCALQIQQQLRNYRAGDVELRLRVAISAGRVGILHVGGVFGRWEFIVAGRPLEEVGEVGDQVDPGDVGLSSEIADLLQACGAGLRTTGHGQGIGRLEYIDAPAPSVAEQPVLREEHQPYLRAYLPAAITHRLDAGLDGYLGELRRLTILFVNLPDITFQTPVDRAQEIMVALQRSTYRYEGSINKLSVDDKGVSLLAGFGMPPMAHEDDPERGVRAALTIQSALQALGIRSSVGVSTGRVYCGIVGAAGRREYTIMGDSVNLAARLMQQADGGVLCDESTRRRCETLEFGSPRQLQLKGKQHPETVFAPQNLTQPNERPITAAAPMVGRHQERALLRGAISDLVEIDRSSVILLEAEAGYGKSRIKDDLLSFADSQPVTVLECAADAVERSTPYFGIRQLLLRCLNETSADLAGRVQRELATTPYAVLAPLLNVVLPIELEETEATRQYEGSLRSAQVAQVVSALVRQAAPGERFLLVMDDVHWLDSASWGVLALLARELVPSVVLVVSRPIPDPPAELSALLSRAGARTLHLERMDDDEIAGLACARLGVQQLPQAVADLIVGRAEGHPYYAEEVSYALLDSGVIQVIDGECRVADGDLDKLDVPETVEGIITSRIDRLTPSQAMTIKVASALGRTFSLAQVAAIHPVGTDLSVLRAELDECERLHLTPLEVPGDDPGYIFKHMITQEVSYSLLPENQRRELHEAVADWYERDVDGDHSHTLLAFHWEAAGRPEQAVPHLLLAIEEAAEHFANSEVGDLCERALSIIELHGIAVDHRASLLSRLGHAQRELGRSEEAEVTLRAAVDAFGYPAPQSVPGLIGGLVFQALEQYARAQGWLRAPNRQRPELVEVAEAFEQSQLLYYFNGDSLRLLYSGLRAANLATRSGTLPHALVRTNVSLGLVGVTVGLAGMAEYYMQVASDQAEALAHPATSVWVLLVRATYRNGIGELARAEADFDRSIEISRAIDDEAAGFRSVSARCTLLIHRGRLEQANDGYRSQRAYGERIGDRYAIGMGLTGEARVLYRRNDWSSLAAVLDQLEGFLDEVQFGQLIDYRTLRALQKLRADDPDGAVNEIEAAVSLLRRPNQITLYSGASQLANAVLELRARFPDSPSASLWKASLRFLRQLARVYPVGEVLLRQALAVDAILQGQAQQARLEWKQGWEAAVRFDLPIERAQLLELQQRLNPGQFDPERLRSELEGLSLSTAGGFAALQHLKLG